MTQARKFRTITSYTINNRGTFAAGGFTCIQCRQFVTCAAVVAGVQNRNHCPACLWSRHMDEHVAGDRLAVCRGAMEPIALTTKRSRNRYGGARDGELMLVHRCSGCGKVVINRIAADDSPATLLETFEASWQLDLAELDRWGIAALGAHDRLLVRQRLFGS